VKTRIKKGDLVMVIAGDDGPHGSKPGERGRVLAVDGKRGLVTVEGVNMIIKHRRRGRGTTPQQMQTGRIEMSAPISISNVMLVCPRCDRPTRIAIRTGEAGRSRVCKRCGEIVDQI
jgi:large subunit ribosomal protein L24